MGECLFTGCINRFQQSTRNLNVEGWEEGGTQVAKDWSNIFVYPYEMGQETSLVLSCYRKKLVLAATCSFDGCRL